MNHYVANPFTIHQRLYIYISLYRLPRYLTPYYPYYPKRKPPLTIQPIHTPNALLHIVSLIAVLVYRSCNVCMTHHMIVPTSDSPSSLFDPSSSVHTLVLFSTSIFQIRYDTITIDLCIAMGNYIESYPHRPEHSLLTACSITEKYQSP